MALINPINSAPSGPTNAQAGVMPTSPPIAPEASPKPVTCPVFNFSTTIQPKIPVQVASIVVTNATIAESLIASAEPTLKPNQPSHKNAMPINVKITL